MLTDESFYLEFVWFDLAIATTLVMDVLQVFFSYSLSLSILQAWTCQPTILVFPVSVTVEFFLFLSCPELPKRQIVPATLPCTLVSQTLPCLSSSQFMNLPLKPKYGFHQIVPNCSHTSCTSKVRALILSFLRKKMLNSLYEQFFSIFNNNNPFSLFGVLIILYIAWKGSLSSLCRAESILVWAPSCSPSILLPFLSVPSSPPPWCFIVNILKNPLHSWEHRNLHIHPIEDWTFVVLKIYRYRHRWIRQCCKGSDELEFGAGKPR